MDRVHTIAVAPIDDASGAAEGLDLAEALAAELVQFPDVAVIRPEALVEAARRSDVELRDDRSLRTVGRLAGADAVLVVSLREYDPFYPPRVGVAARLVFCRASATRGQDAIELSGFGQAVPASARTLSDTLSIERVYDGAHRETRHMACRYALGHDSDDDALDGTERVLRLPDLYFRFVSNRLVRDIFADYQARQNTAKKENRA